MNDDGGRAANRRARPVYCAARLSCRTPIRQPLLRRSCLPAPLTSRRKGALAAACAAALALAVFAPPASAASCALGSNCGAAGGSGNPFGGFAVNGGMGNGTGGDGSNLGLPPQGGSPSDDGNGGNGADGISGIGGIGGAVGATSIGGSSISGGDGGAGVFGGGGGGGGGGGAGVYSSATTLTIGNGLTIRGGDGGDGGTDTIALNGGGGGGGAGLVSTAAGAGIVNFGTIAGGDGGDGGSGDPVSWGGGGGGGGDGVVLFGDNTVLTNSGAVTSGSGGTGGPSATGGAGGDGVRVLSHGSTVVNHGSITAASAGSGSNAGIFMLDGGTVRNEQGASITAVDGEAFGVELLNGGSVTNDASSISGASIGLWIENASGTVINRNGARITSTGYGIGLKSGGSVTNDASTISGNAGGISMNASGTVINQNGASISGGRYGVALAAGGAVTNGAGSIIKTTGTSDGDCNAGGTGDCAIAVPTDVGAGGPLTLSNAGNIIGKVQLDGSAANVVTLVSGGSINGDLDIGTNTASTLTLDGSGTQLYSQAVTGVTIFAGALAKQGSGTWIINGTLAPASTTINAGKLVVGDDSHPGATLGGTVTLKPGGALGGIGAIGALVNSGTVAPGGSIGTLNVTGNYVSNTGSVYQVEVDPAGHSDLIKVAGTATLNGGQVQALAQNGTYQPSTRYTILIAAGGLTGRYDSVTSNLAFLTPSLSYDPDAVYLTMTRNQANLADAGVTPNQRATGAALDAGSANPPAGLAAVYTALLNATTAQAPGELDSLSGDALTVFPLIAQDDARRFSAKLGDRALGHGAPAGIAMLDPRVRLAFAGENLAQLLAQTNASAYGAAPSADPGGWSGWVTAGGARNHAGGDGNGPGFSANSGEIALGIERRVNPDLRVGAAAGYTDTSADVNDNRNASGDLHSWHVGAYLGYERGPWFADGSAAYSGHHIYTTRNLTVGGTGQAKASFTADTLALWGEAGRHFSRGGVDIDPSVTLRVMSTHTPDFSESGAASALQVEGGHLDSQRLGIGVRFSGITHTNGVAIHPSAAIRYEHEFGDSTVALTNELSGLDAFTVKGPQLGREIVSANLAIEARVQRHLTVYGGVDASWRQNQDTQAIEVGLKYVW